MTAHYRETIAMPNEANPDCAEQFLYRITERGSFDIERAPLCGGSVEDLWNSNVWEVVSTHPSHYEAVAALNNHGNVWLPSFNEHFVLSVDGVVARHLLNNGKCVVAFPKNVVQIILAGDDEKHFSLVIGTPVRNAHDTIKDLLGWVDRLRPAA